MIFLILLLIINNTFVIEINIIIFSKLDGKSIDYDGQCKKLLLIFFEWLNHLLQYNDILDDLKTKTHSNFILDNDQFNNNIFKLQIDFF